MATTTEVSHRLPVDELVRTAARRLADGDADGALAALTPLVTGAPPVPVRFVMALAAWHIGRLDWAVDLARLCHGDAPMNGTVAEVLASLYAQAGDIGESLYMGKLATALGCSDELTSLVPPAFPPFDRAFLAIQERPLLARTKLHLASGKLHDAIESARQHVALRGDDHEGRVLFATLLLRDGGAAAAIETLKPIERDAGLPGSFATVYASALAAVGESDEAQRWHERAASAVPDDPAIAAARVADAAWTAGDAAELAEMERQWAGRFCPAGEPSPWRRPEGELVIGYFVSSFTDPADAAAVAAVARSHDRQRVRVLGYGRGAQSWGENVPLRGAFDQWRDISTLDPATLARFIVRDGVQVAVDASGFAAPQTLLALARTPTVLRVAWLGSPGMLGQPIYDARIEAQSADLTAGSWRIGGGYPITAPGARAQTRSARDSAAFGADVCLCQIDTPTVALWSSILQSLPTAKLLLRANDMAAGGNIERLISRFGRDLAARIDVVQAAQASDFYALVDVALAPRRGASARMAAEALACGVPVVALAAERTMAPYAAFLRGLGLGSMLVASDERDYAGIALGLAASPEARAQVRTAAAPHVQQGAEVFARELERQAMAMFEERTSA